MSSNFDLLEDEFPNLARLGAQAESYALSDSHASLFKQGLLGETIVSALLERQNIPIPSSANAVERINLLKRNGLASDDVITFLHILRKVRNVAVHSLEEPKQDAFGLLPMTYNLCVWFYSVMTSRDFVYRPFDETAIAPAATVPLTSPSDDEAAGQAEIAKAAQEEPVSKTDFDQRSSSYYSQQSLTEAETRVLIDEQLRRVGWEVPSDSDPSVPSNPTAGRNLAIPEWRTGSSTNTSGRADYALFVGQTLIGFIEAKAARHNISSVVDTQASEYARNVLPADQNKYCAGRWGDFFVPFVFSSNGRPYFEQLATHSGVWFKDLRNPLSPPHAMRGWPSPMGLMEKLEHDLDAARERLVSMDNQILKSPSGLNLRDYQLKAIQAAEDAITAGQQRILLAMATGTGKTRTILGLIYRLLKSERFHRILFLVDRSTLGNQAIDTFKDVKLEQLLTLDQLYDIKGLDERSIASETKVHVATVQSMVRALEGTDEIIPAVTDYDLVIVDEAHRGYLLDKEMSEDELLYRDQRDYQSAYRSVLEYFEGTKIALTATPALHTTEIFGEPVFSYSYREAVLDGWLVDHDAPHRLSTKLSVEGIKFEHGSVAPIYDPVTGELKNSEKLADDVVFEVDDFNKDVITESFNRTVLEEIADDLQPNMPDLFGKTLIFAVNDVHADLIVKILHEIYAEKGIPTDAILKITGSIAGGNKKKIEAVIKQFKNEQFPSIAVTVDLLSTGVDVPEITNLVFMRRVKSRILFEQMLGRATRLCPAIRKEKFVIYDPVGVYESLAPVSTMKPLSVRPNASFADLLRGFDTVENSEGKQRILTEIISKLQRKQKVLSKEQAENFKNLNHGVSIDSLIDKLKSTSIDEAPEFFSEIVSPFDFLDGLPSGPGKRIYVSNAPDELLSHTVDYGIAQEPQDYLDEFANFIRNNQDQVAALKILATRPGDLTRAELKNLRALLGMHHFTEAQLSQAYSQVTNQEIMVDIITMIRRFSLGSAIMTHAERVDRAFKRLEANHSFDRIQRAWLKRIRQILDNELVITSADFEHDPRLKESGGFSVANKVFTGNLIEIISEFNDYMYDDGQAMSA
ncbi:type I restriction-modification system endonuclease [Boudabousia liubingyangii]|uniref:Type I restriction-modification system endonuclease n=1 Tax=Boudabousia liubingyangii TaxID=1921764 RepID=A0A1Q5PJL1_9ACTO|nr:type I restriction-modification system endonuclease [Boudabousia liubingyangii]OKL46127.1 type I restriction-modification system endonuclease [Boudabousia liubingyangii]